MRSPKANSRERYIRARENPYFNDLFNGGDAPRGRTSTFQGNGGNQNVQLPEDSLLDIVLEPFSQSTFEKPSKINETSFPITSFESDLSIELDHTYGSMKESSPENFEETVEFRPLPVVAIPVIEKSYIVLKRKTNLSKIPLPQSAAAFYNVFSSEVEIVESCESIKRLNSFLKARKDDVNAGFPGKFLHAVIGQDVSDVGSLASTIMYAFYLNETLESNQFCTVPVINMKRADLSFHAELKWLLDSSQIDESSLIFVDEIDLSYYDLFGSLKLVMLNGHKLPAKQEALKNAVVEIFNCRKGETAYDWVQTLTAGQDCSCCTLIAEKFALISPEILAEQGFSRLLLAGILFDTVNLTSPQCSTKDMYMATLLINGAGRFGCDGLYQILRYKMYDVSDLTVLDILRKDFKKWRKAGKSSNAGSRLMVGMSSTGISIAQLLDHEVASVEEIKYFLHLEKLRLLMIVSGYYDPQKNFKRETLIATESAEIMNNLLLFFDSNASHLPLKALHQPGLVGEMRAFELDKVTSRKTIEHLLEEFGASRG